MADEISTLELKVELDCHPCYKKMKKALSKFPEIERQNFDEEQKKVIISGPFEPEKLIKKLYCKVGCKIIKGYVIILDPPKPAPTKPKPSPPKTESPKPSPPKTESPKPAPKPVPLVPGPVNIVIGPIGPVCSCRPFQLSDYSIPVDCNCRPQNPTCHCSGSYGNCQCRPYYYPTCHSNSHGYQGNCQCGCGGNYESGCRFFIEEEQSTCMIM